MAKVIGGSSVTGAGGESSIPSTGTPGAVVGYDETGALVASVALDLQANSGVFGDGIEAKRASVEDNLIASDPDTGNAIAVDANDGITANASQITPDMIAGISVAPTLSAENPVVLDDDSRLSDTRDPTAHGENPHIGMIGAASQIRVTPNDYTGNLAGITGEDASVKDALVAVDGLSLGGDVDAEDVTYTPDANGTTWELQADGSTNESTTKFHPDMTSNTAPSPYVVSAESTQYGSGEYKAFKGTNTGETDCWHSTGGANPWLKLFCGAGGGKAVNKYRIQSRNVDPTYAYWPTGGWSLKGSNDGTNWDTLDTQNPAYPGQNLFTAWFTFSNNTVYDYYKFDFVCATYVAIGEVQLVDAALEEVPFVKFYPGTGIDTVQDGLTHIGDYLYGVGTEVFPAMAPQGRLEVWPGYCELTNDVGVQLNATTDLAQFRWVQKTHYYGPFLPFSWYCDAVGAAGDVTWTLYAVEDAGTLTSLDNATTAISSTGWKRETGLAVNVTLVAGRSYALVVSVSAGDDISLSCNRNNTSITSALPDGVTSYISTDGGTNWTACLKDTYYPAVLNVQLNTTAAHEPYLHYGRYVGQYAPCLNAAGTEWFLGEIPAVGLNLDVSDLTADTLTHVFLKEAATAGTLALEASQSVTTWTQVNGRAHAGTNSEKLHIGDIAPTTLGSGLVGPMDVCQQRLVANVFHEQRRFLGKLCPYVGTTAIDSSATAAWVKFNNADDYSCRFVSCKPQLMQAFTRLIDNVSSTGFRFVVIWFASTTPPTDWRGQAQAANYWYVANIQSRTYETERTVGSGLNYMVPWHYKMKVIYWISNGTMDGPTGTTNVESSCLV